MSTLLSPFNSAQNAQKVAQVRLTGPRITGGVATDGGDEVAALLRLESILALRRQTESA